MLIEIEKIKIKNRIRKDFGNIQELADDIKVNGLINPPVITPDTYELITGERRIRAMKLLGYKQIEVRPMAVKDAEHQLNLEISENEARKDFSKAERIDYARRLERIESLKAKGRMSDGGKGRQKSDNLRTDDSVAEKLGIGSRDTYRKEKYIVENQKSLTTDDFADWDEGKLSTNKAFTKIKIEKERLEKENKILETQKKISDELAAQYNTYLDSTSFKYYLYENGILDLKINRIRNTYKISENFGNSTSEIKQYIHVTDGAITFDKNVLEFLVNDSQNLQDSILNYSRSTDWSSSVKLMVLCRNYRGRYPCFP